MRCTRGRGRPVRTFPRRVPDAAGIPVRRRMESCPVRRDPPEGHSLSELEVRLAGPDERPLSDALMDECHCSGGRREGSTRSPAHVFPRIANMKGCLAAAAAQPARAIRRSRTG